MRRAATQPSWLRRHRATTASIAVIALAAAAVVTFAVSATGNPSRRVDLHDGGIWVTNDAKGLAGRFNKPIAQLDTGVLPPGGAQASYALDVVQNGSLVVLRDLAQSKLYPIDVSLGQAASSDVVAMPASNQVALGGSTIAALDPATGKLWATVSDPDADRATVSALDSSLKPLLTVGPKAALAVSQSGTVFAVSGNQGLLVTIPVRNGRLGTPVRQHLGTTLTTPEITAVGDHPVLLDTATAKVVLPNAAGDGAHLVTLNGSAALAQLQQPGPSTSSVVVSTQTGAQRVSLETKAGPTKPAVLFAAGAGAPAAPVVLGDCVHAAWKGSPGVYARACGTAKMQALALPQGQALNAPVFRVNRSQIVLNDTGDGRLWIVDGTPQKVDNWTAVQPPPTKQDTNAKKNPNNANNSREDRPPHAVADQLAGRAGRTNVLHVLDNDSDPDGDILAVSGVKARDAGGSNITVAPDGQTVQVDTPPGATAPVTFSYSVDDGRGHTSEADVSMSIHDASTNAPPVLRQGYKDVAGSVAAAGTYSAPVLSDYRDPDSDPLVLVAASVADGTVTTTTDGRILFDAPPEAATLKVKYTVQDSGGLSANGTRTVKVLPADSSTAVAPIAEPDVVRATVGTAVSITPLANDQPGSDPTDPDATLQLVGQVAAPANTTVQTDEQSGTLTFAAQTPGTYNLTYGASFGSSIVARGPIRVDVQPRPASQQPIITSPDAVVLHGQQASIVDVLANDFDPSGGVLSVQTAADSQDNGSLQVAIIQNHWLRIVALAPDIGDARTVRYTVDDGVSPTANGDVTVTQLQAPALDAPPIPQDDSAEVRAGDAVTVPVLDNDTDPDGDPLSLRAGPVTVTPAVGRADVFQNGIRYFAPANIRTQQQVTVDYTAVDPSGVAATGHLRVTLSPPGDAAHDQPPRPQDVSRGITSGDTQTIPVPTTGVDPDGDSVTVVGIDSPPHLGRVLGFGANSIQYQAYPDISGSDVLTYVVQDQYGLTGTAQVRIAVVGPGSPQPPVAVNDPITAAPNATVHVDVLANDFVTPGDHVSLLPLAKSNVPLPSGVSLAKGDVVSVKASAVPGAKRTVYYELSDGTGTPSKAAIVVRTQAGYDNPPVALDDEAKAPNTGSIATVDVLANDSDPDAATGELQVLPVADPATRVVDNKLQIGLQKYPRSVAYTVADAHGATAIGVVHVPGIGAEGPQLRPDVGQIKLDPNSSVTVPIADYVFEPGGAKLRLTTTDRIYSSPTEKLTVRAKGTDSLTLTAGADYRGPGSVTFEVTDAKTLGQPGAHSAVVTVPVQVGSPQPVFRCPTTTQTLVEGGNPIKIDVTTVCHVWTAQPGDINDVQFSAAWSTRVASVTLGQEGPGGRVVVATAGGAAKAGTTGTITIGARGTTAKSTLKVQVIGAPKPTVAPISIGGVKAGTTQRIDVQSAVQSPLADKTVQILSAGQSSGEPATVTRSGSALTITPGLKSHGPMTFSYQVTDAAGRADRAVVGRVTLQVLGVPGQPGRPAVTSVSSRTAVLAFGVAADNGSPITQYRVTDNHGGVHSCAASPCTITGLQNAVPYTFTVTAINAVGTGDPSVASVPATPDQVPDAPAGISAQPGDTTATVTWAAAHTEGSPVSSYQVQISPDPGSGATKPVSAGSTTTIFRGLANGTSYSFRVRAHNAAKASGGYGPWSSSTSVVPFGTPVKMAPPSASAGGSQSVAAHERTITVAWAAANGNGRAVTGYTVTEYPSSGGSTPKAVTGTSTTFAHETTNITYTYTVQATNAGKLTSPPSDRSAAVDVSTVPDQMAQPSAAVAGKDNTATITYTVPKDNGAAISGVNWQANGQTGTLPAAAGTHTITGLTNGQSYAFVLTAMNKNGSGVPSAPSNAVVPYGPPPTPTAHAEQDGPNSDRVNVSWTVGAPNGRPLSCVMTVNGSRNGLGQTCANGSASVEVGYDTVGKLDVTVTDSTGQTKHATASAKSGTKYVPPPDPAAVTVSHGRSCPSGGCNDGSGNTCTSSSCAYIHIDVKNFANDGSATCSLKAEKHGSWADRDINLTNGSGGSDTSAFYGYPGTTVTATCHSKNQSSKSDTINW